MFHGHFNKYLLILFALLLVLNVLDVHSTYLVIESGQGIETNLEYQEVNDLEFSFAISDKIWILGKMLISLTVFVLCTEGIFYYNDKHDHVLDNHVHHLTWYMKYGIFFTFVAINLFYVYVVTHNYFLL
ncbi:Uncharacterised protein [Candidatus Venteria ishoeyi]|uniref:Uncharacterized protein n=1 Tax=Candidatus Venteria ishoeyi TaxID=1899563 RepID=A0A1H6F6W3_9GAMM|nr:Uncharacterised protein [Candidatus Venteria ishoeyi]